MNIIDPNETADVIYCIDVLACIFIMHFFGNDCLRSCFLKLLSLFGAYLTKYPVKLVTVMIINCVS